MKKNILVFSVLVLTLMLSVLVRSSAASISSPKWLEPTFSGTDGFYGSPAPTIVAYVEGSTAKLAVPVTTAGSGSPWINVTWVRVTFDWGKTYNSTEADGVLPATEINATISVFVFNIAFTTPSTSEASNLVRHSYTITVTYDYIGGTSTFTSSGSDFVVYSTTQANAQALNEQVDAYTTWTFQSSAAQVLWQKGKNDAATGDTQYRNGAFADAAASYQSALDFFNQAFDAEEAYQTAVQTAYNTAASNYYNAVANNAGIQANASRTQADASILQANAATTQAEAALRQADAALTNAYGWLAFGIGWIFIGIGAIVYALRRPSKPAA